jgi:hypothetical protein
MHTEFRSGRFVYPNIEPQRPVLKEKDIVLTNEYWHIAINLDVTTYQDVTADISEDLLLINSQRRESTEISELKQIEALLETLELKLYNFQQVFSRLDAR